MGVSFDAPSKNQAWAEAEDFEFELWTDSEENTLAVAYGAASSSSSSAASRITVLLDEAGTWLLTYEGINADIGAHPAQVLEDCEALFGP